MNFFKSMFALLCRHRRNRGLQLRDSSWARQRGNAMVETTVALLALAPFIAGIPLLGKQLDIKQKAFEATRYSVWERTVWRSDGSGNRKNDADISLEARDRSLGDPRAGVLAVESIRTRGVTENLLWRDQQGHRLLDYDSSVVPVTSVLSEQSSPVAVGYALVPGVAYGEGPLSAVEDAMRVHDLHLNQRTYITGSVSVGLTPVLQRMADRRVSAGLRSETQNTRDGLVQPASGAVLSDVWSVRDEGSLRSRVDDLTANELVEALELAGRPIAMQALGKGRSLYGEGQFGWDPDLRPRSEILPTVYVSHP
jgi:hypothetical protein